METEVQIEKEDIQGLLVRGFKMLNAASYVMLQFSEPGKAKQYLDSLCSRLTDAREEPENVAVQFAFTIDGIKKLQLPRELTGSFSRQFKEGMTESTRRIVLGDVAENAPENWEWGNWSEDSQHKVIHGMLMLFAKDKAMLEDIYQIEKEEFLEHAITVVTMLDSKQLSESKEHFGFQDGISQPTIKGLSSRVDPRPDNVINAGEFILGYNNSYNQLPDSPFVFSVGDPDQILPHTTGMDGIKDFGRNGSYMVFRQMSQDVPAFWKYLKENSNEKADTPEDAAVALGAKMMGRWPEGEPLSKSWDPKDTSMNNFGFWKDDALGTQCPVGAHIRRANPRDYLVTVKDEKQNDAVRQVSTEMIQKHRILRRGRTYGDALAPSMKPADLMNAAPDGKDRGIHFICFAGDLVRQYEFIQNAWMKFHKFGGLHNDSNPVVGTRNLDGAAGETITADHFIVPAEPVRRRYKELPQFTKVKGGAYFFMPGIKAFRYLCAMYKT